VGLGAEGPLGVGDLVGAPVVLDLGRRLAPGPLAPGRLGHQAQRLQDIAGAVGFDGHAGGAPLPGQGPHDLSVLWAQVGVGFQPAVAALLVLAQLPLPVMGPVDLLGGHRQSTRYAGRVVIAAAQPAKHARRLATGGLLIGSQRLLGLLGLLAVGGGPGQLAAAVTRGLVELATQPIPLGPQLTGRESLEIWAARGVDGQGLAAGPGQGLSELQVSVGLVPIRQVQLAGALGFGADYGVQPGVVASSGQLHIQPVHIFCAGEPDQRPPASQPLGAVAGGGIGQIHPPIPLPLGASLEVGPGQGDRAAIVAVEPHGEGPALGVEGGDDPAAAVGDPELGDGVVAADDPVPDRQLAVLDLEALGAEAPAGGQEFLASAVEPVDFDPARGQHDDPLGRVLFGSLPGGPPVLQQRQGGGRFGVGGHHPIMGLVGRHRLPH